MVEVVEDGGAVGTTVWVVSEVAYSRVGRAVDGSLGRHALQRIP